jgi:polyisoprenoid-binding protein YceI
MRLSMLAVLALLAFAGCKSQATAPVAAAPQEPAAPSLPVPAVPKLSRWALDPENSSVGFVVKHVLTNARGMFARPSGTVVLDDATPANSKLNATVDVGLISTGVEERDAHLKSSEFLDVARYPAITFDSTLFVKTSATEYAVTGNLTLHGVTKAVTLAVTAPPPFNHAGGIRRGIEATLAVNRRDYGLVWDYPGEGPGAVVGDTIKLTIDAELVLEGAPGSGG